MGKQRAISLSIDDIADWLKEKHGFPDDTEVCNVTQIPGTTSVIIMVHFDAMKELPLKYWLYSVYRPEDTLSEWKKDETKWEELYGYNN